jgi:glycosyltransferase involved in cell wall biosynthesis
MKFSIVTISYNQAEFLERAIQSVIGQNGVKLEYIVVDPGSTDGSRDIIERYVKRISHVIFEPDIGPADGLNKGFALATGDICGYLNSDDIFEPDALSRVADFFGKQPRIDVVCGHAWITDRYDNRIRKVWSDPFRRRFVAAGAAVQIQPSTFFRKSAFDRSGGFNVSNRSNWDGELLVDMFRSGAGFSIINEFLSAYRLHDVSITNSGASDSLLRLWDERRFEKLVGRKPLPGDRASAAILKTMKHLLQPRATIERILKGPVYRRGMQ